MILNVLLKIILLYIYVIIFLLKNIYEYFLNMNIFEKCYTNIIKQSQFKNKDF